MANTVTLSFRIEGPAEKSGMFTFEELGITDDMDQDAIEKHIEKIFESWVWGNIAFSRVVRFEEE
ncbi:hypothetical protein [Aureibacillus halotolerans]|uniref:Uncharacterized protein n=1 Tax=Aureibacillus halotolerans TaxID=1508390 RepID=A0A4V3D5P2_9BACI|nr:hypothetical protein [Aureibacillus halotolerans]TDQ40717.1 hypothetical protein EV213_10563 [Aureibacillus halotolerans]